MILLLFSPMNPRFRLRLVLIVYAACAFVRADEFDVVITCTAPSSRGMPAGELTAAARAVGCDEVLEIPVLEQAIDRARAIAGNDDAVLITGSLYVIGNARPYLRKTL